MQSSVVRKKNRWRKWVIGVAAFGGAALLAFIIFVNTWLEPMLKDRLRILIVQGSDSLYTYKLGNLRANFFGGAVELENLNIDINAAKYNQLKAANALPPLTMQLTLGRGHIKGVGILSLLFSKKIKVGEIFSKDANIRFLRHIQQHRETKAMPPLWQAIQPNISSIRIKKIKLDGIKMLYKDVDTVDALKLQFDTCNAELNDIVVDSAAAVDPSRIGFARTINLQFRDLKFRTADSAYKMKAAMINYSSEARTFEITEFKLQPTLKERADFYRGATQQKAMNVIEFNRLLFTQFRLDRYLHDNIIAADSLLLVDPLITMYTDRTLPRNMESKLGKYPHQQLLKAGVQIAVKGIGIQNLSLAYTEKAEKTGNEGTMKIEKMNVQISNVTNNPAFIKQNPVCTAVAQGLVIGSPLQAKFQFFLDSADGQFTAEGNIKNVQAAQLNALAVPMANTNIRSLNLKGLQFALRGDGFSARGSVRMQYDNLFVELRKKDEETGEVSTKKFLTKIINKFTLQEQNPGPDGVERVADNVVRARVSTQPFFGFVWKTIYTGMQQVMVKQGSL